ncbi:MAG: class 3 adenylate cyclase, partial [Gammaproteobacteria bacterium]
GAITLDNLANDMPTQADRRLLTVMFCDIVDSTALSERFDPEELRELVRVYQQTCAAIIERYEGHIAQYLGDGLLIYFGYPVAQEDEAYQAVRSAIEILQKLGTTTAITDRLGAPMRVRIGIHTGPVVIGEMGGSGRTERLALGDTPNIAARVQGMARPDEILISESTHRLVEGLFHVTPLGAQDLKGVTKSFDLYRVLSENTAESPFEVALSTGRLTRFIGQTEELSLLNQHWTQAQASNGQIVMLSAEPGMGKSRLAQEFKTRVAGTQTRQMTFRCSPYHQNSALYPIIQVMQRVFRFDGDDEVADKLSKVTSTLDTYEFSNPDAAALMCGLLSLPHPDLNAPRLKNAHQRREQLFQLLVEWFLEESRRAAVYMIWDDLHWADPSTVDFIEYYLDHVPTSATLAVLIYRSNYVPAWKRRGFFRYMSLNRLSEHYIEELATNVAGDCRIPKLILEQIIDKTDGIPLYVEELTRTIVESGVLDSMAEGLGDVSLERAMIPLSLQDSLEARLDRCPIGKEIAQWGATIGREFNYAVLRSVVSDESRVKSGIAELLEAELIYRSGSPSVPTFIFKHALLRDTAYESLLIRKRREFHAQIAQTLEKEFSRIDETQPEVIAYHFTEGERIDDAIRYWHRAAKYALGRSADKEARKHLERGLDLIQRLARNKRRAELELDLQLLLGTLTISAKGNSAPEVETIYRQAVSLADEIGTSAARTPAYFGLRSYYLSKGDLDAEHGIAIALLEAAETDDNADALLEAHVALANSFFYLGIDDDSLHHATTAQQMYDIDKHSAHASVYGLDPGATSHVRLGEIAWLKGSLKDSLTHLEGALSIAQTIEHPYTQVFVLGNISRYHHWVHDYKSALGCINTSIALCEHHGYGFYRSAALVMSGNLLVHLGDVSRGIGQIEEGLESIELLRSHLAYPALASLFADALGSAGDPERGLALLPDATATIQRTGARHFEIYLYQTRAQLLGLAKLPTEAERAFMHTISIAQSRGQTGAELKATIGISKLDLENSDTTQWAKRLEQLCVELTSEADSIDYQAAQELIAASR